MVGKNDRTEPLKISLRAQLQEEQAKTCTGEPEHSSKGDQGKGQMGGSLPSPTTYQVLQLVVVPEAMPQNPTDHSQSKHRSVKSSLNSPVTLIRAGFPGATGSGDTPWYRLVRNGLKLN